MEWKYDNINKEWALTDGSDIFSKIVIKENIKAAKNKFKVKVLLHKMLCGKKKYTKLERKKNTWYVIKEKKFSDLSKLENYIKIKQNELLKYLSNF